MILLKTTDESKYIVILVLLLSRSFFPLKFQDYHAFVLKKVRF